VGFLVDMNVMGFVNISKMLTTLIVKRLKMGKTVYVSLFILFGLLFSCGKNRDINDAKTQGVKTELINKEHFFGKAKFGDTINHTFLIRNMSNYPYKINKVGTSCGCTTVSFTKNNIERGGYAEIDVSYVPTSDDIGSISKSIVVSDNSNMGFNTLYIKGEIIKK